MNKSCILTRPPGGPGTVLRSIAPRNSPACYHMRSAVLSELWYALYYHTQGSHTARLLPAVSYNEACFLIPCFVCKQEKQEFSTDQGDSHREKGLFPQTHLKIYRKETHCSTVQSLLCLRFLKKKNQSVTEINARLHAVLDLTQLGDILINSRKKAPFLFSGYFHKITTSFNEFAPCPC